MAGHGWAQTAPRVNEARLARGRGSVGSGWGSGGASERASVDAMRRRGQHEGSRKRPIGGSPRPQWAAWRMAGHGGRNAGGEARRVQDGGDERGRDGRERRPRGHKRDGRGAHAASRPGPRRRAQSPFGHAACRMPLPHGAKPIRPDRRPLPRKGRAALATSSRHA